MEKGIATSRDLFDHTKINVFFYEEEIGSVTETPTGLTVLPLNPAKGTKAIPVNHMEQAVECLLNIRNTRPVKVKIPPPRGPQIALFG